MFLTTHTAAGIAISRYINDPLAVFAVAFASHFILDFIPHGDETLYRDEEWKFQHKYRRVFLLSALDVGAMFGLILWSLNQQSVPSSHLMVVGILGSILPDLFTNLFPLIHERFSWLSLVRWLYAVTKPTGLRFVVRGQNWIHNLLHHEIIRRDVPFRVGLVIQVALVVTALSLIR